MSLELLAPAGLLVCLAGLVPAAVAAAVALRGRRAAALLGLAAESWGGPARRAAPLAAACVLAGLAAAQPVLRTTEERERRTQSELFFVVDVSRSMLASAARGEPTRLERARAVVRRLRSEVPDVPAGLAGLTDRVLPYVFPTVDDRTFAAALQRSVEADSPPPQQTSVVATTFEPLAGLAVDGWFDRGAARRTCVVVTDGETRSAGEEPEAVEPQGPAPLPALGGDGAAGGDAPAAGGPISGETGRTLAGERGCRLVAVRVGGADDRIFLPGGRVEAAYRPDPAAGAKVERLVAAADGAAFAEDELDDAAAAVRGAAAAGPVERIGTRPAVHPLTPWLAASALAVALLSFSSVAQRIIRALRSTREWDASL